MTRPLIAVTSDDSIKQHLVHLDSVVVLADDLDDVPDLFDELFLAHGVAPLVVVGQDFADDHEGPAPHFDVVLLYTEPDEIDWHALFWLAPGEVLWLPGEWAVFLEMLGAVVPTTGEAS